MKNFSFKVALSVVAALSCWSFLAPAHAQNGMMAPPIGYSPYGSQPPPVQPELQEQPPARPKFQTIPVRGGWSGETPSPRQGLQSSVPASTYDVPPFYQNPNTPTPSPYAYGGPLFPYYGSASPYYPGYGYAPYMPSMNNPMPMSQQPPGMAPMMAPVQQPMTMNRMPPMGLMNPGMQPPMPQQPPMGGGYVWNGAQRQAVAATAGSDAAELGAWRNLARTPFNITLQGREAIVEWAGTTYKVPIGPDNRVQLYLPQPK